MKQRGVLLAERLKTKTELLKFLNENKALFGFADWTVELVEKKKVAVTNIAQVIPNHLEKHLEITLYKDFYHNKDRRNILIHELIHGRICVMRVLTEKLTEDIEAEIEEQTVNDLTRGVVALLK